MKYENVLLIGGPKDGKWISVTEGVPSIRVAMAAETPAFIGIMPNDRELVVRVTEYRRVTMTGDQGFKGCVYVFDGVEPMSALINGYRQPNHSKA